MNVSTMRHIFAVLLTVLVMAVSTVSFPTTALADGGPILSDPQLWAVLKEGQQTAVVTITDRDTARVDLFVSMLDDSGESHEIVYFVPLGAEPSDVGVIERDSLSFDRELTEELDMKLRQEATRERDQRLYMLAATSVISGGWMLPLSIPFLLTGCGAEYVPEATFQTESSSVSVYGLNEETDLEDLINTTGLDPSVKDTLSRLKGQRIAVITLHTQPSFQGGDGTGSYRPTGQPGLHLTWNTKLAHESENAVYNYPLGTGAAWSQPIDLTRVYIVAPPEIDFSVKYPKLGANRSGYDMAFVFGRDTMKITNHYGSKAYAVDEATGSFGRVWRATYSMSNASEDIIISVHGEGLLQTMRRSVAEWGFIPYFLVGLVLALVLWVVAWRYIAPRMLGIKYTWRNKRLWQDSLVTIGINTGVIGAAILFLVILFYIAGIIRIFAMPLVALGIIIPAIFGVPAIHLYVRRQWWNTDWPGPNVTWRRTLGTYIFISVAANAAYIGLVLALTTLVI